MYSPNLWILNMFCLSSHFPKPWKDRTFPNRLQKQEIFPALSGSLETQVHKLHDGICRKIKRTQVIQGFLLWSHVHVKRIPNAAYLDKKFWRSFCKGLMIDWLPVGHKNAHIKKSRSRQLGCSPPTAWIMNNWRTWAIQLRNNWDRLAKCFETTRPFIKASVFCSSTIRGLTFCHSTKIHYS